MLVEKVYMPNPKKTTNYETMHNIEIAIEIAEQAILHKIKMSFLKWNLIFHFSSF